jgi:hypothetical protein
MGAMAYFHRDFLVEQASHITDEGSAHQMLNALIVT